MLNVLISRGQSQNPVKRALEDEVARGAAQLPGVRAIAAPNLYDLKPDGDNVGKLRRLEGDLVVLAWNYPRATRWILDRHGVRGQPAESQLVEELDEDEDDEDWDEEAGDEDKARVAAERDDTPRRRIFCIDFKVAQEAEPFVEELRRIVETAAAGAQGDPNGGPNGGSKDLKQWIQGDPSPEQMQRYLAGNPAAEPPQAPGGSPEAPVWTQPVRLDDEGGRRWYPVIDFSRCTNCMECIDFCLFGVYGVDQSETILVEQPDNCRKGCPACSRVCPENAIIFPQHKTPAIAGSPGGNAGLKIDLSQLFGAPDALDVAAQERDEQLLLAGREAVGTAVGMPKRQPDRPDADKDALDNLIDELDELDV